MRIGYARVSTDDQDAGAQLAALKGARCSRIFQDNASGAAADRPQLQAALKALGQGDQLIVWKVDRLSRSLLQLLQLLAAVESRGASFRSLTESIDTTTPAGRALMQMIGTFAEFELAMIRERTRTGLAHARANGAKMGRPHKLNGDQITAALVLLEKSTIAKAADVLKVGSATLKRALRRRRDELLKEAATKGKNDGRQKAKGKKNANAGTPRRAIDGLRAAAGKRRKRGKGGRNTGAPGRGA